MKHNIAAGFFRMAEQYPENVALDVQGDAITYAALRSDALAIAAAIRTCDDGHPYVALFTHRTRAAYAAVLGILAAGKGYVPLHPGFPAERTRRMLASSGCTTIVSCGVFLPALKEVLHGRALHEDGGPLNVILAPDSGDVAAPPEGCRLLPATLEAVTEQGVEVADVEPSQPAYLLFTSGSTGTPKGVSVSHGNASAYLRYVAERYAPNPEDRFSQTFDLTFDLSVHDMFLCWHAGARLCVPRAESVMAPARFLREKRVSVWFSVPSAATFMSRLGMLKADAFPDLRLSLFCGEPLPAATAEAWLRAAPNTALENLYGPTEATIAIAHYPWNPANSLAACANGLVPIGEVFANHGGVVLDENRRPVARGEAGELYLAGAQVTGGYLGDAAKTVEQFVTLPADGRTWYRTGDVVRQDEAGLLHHLGRIDQQVKIRGFRVELAEVEHTVRVFSGAPYVVAVPWPLHQGNPEGLVLAVHGGEKTRDEILAHCKQQLPSYMVPGRVEFMDVVPLNVNGKIDRAAVQHIFSGKDNG